MFASALAGLMFAVLAGPDVSQVTVATDAPEAAVEVQAGWVFVGCWTQFSAGPCKDVYRDSSGQYWVCKECGNTGNPNKNKCQKVSLAQLNSGRWCS